MLATDKLRTLEASDTRGAYCALTCGASCGVTG